VKRKNLRYKGRDKEVRQKQLTQTKAIILLLLPLKSRNVHVSGKNAAAWWPRGGAIGHCVTASGAVLRSHVRAGCHYYGRWQYAPQPTAVLATFIRLFNVAEFLFMPIIMSHIISCRGCHYVCVRARVCVWNIVACFKQVTTKVLKLHKAMAAVPTLPYRCENLSLIKKDERITQTADKKFLSSVARYTGYITCNRTANITAKYT
jgi:hypothetical protein